MEIMPDVDISINMEVDPNKDESEEVVESIPEAESKLPDHDLLTDEDLAELEEELEKTKKTASLSRVKKRDFSILDNVLSEYLDSYIVLGYSAENDEVVIHRIMSPRDSRAIASLLDDISVSPMFSEDD